MATILALPKTQAEQAYARAFAAAPGPAGADWAQTMRRDAAARFEAMGLPHRRVEAWRWTDLRALVRDAPPAAEAGEPVAPRRLKDLDAHRMVFVNGVYAPSLSSPPKDVEVLTLAEALSRPHSALTRRLGSLSALGEPVPLDLNLALMRDGAVIRVPKGATPTKPIHLAFVYAQAEAGSVHARNLVVVEEGAKLSLVETCERVLPDGATDVQYHMNVVTELFVGSGAEVSHVRMQDDAPTAFHLGSVLTELQDKARFESFVFLNGSALSRHQIGLSIVGEGSTTALSGVTLVNGRQHADIALLVDHAAAHCDSRERFKFALDGESRGVFQGKIVVRRGAQKTDAKMSANALFLAESAEFDGKPELEIFADDVQCGHGATAGELDKNHIFYLKSRGIPQDEAEALLVRAYVAAALELVSDEAIRSALETHADSWLSARRKETSR